MVLALPDRWVWDFWVADDIETYHLFFLQAPRALGDPELRHVHASVGHATSSDLRNWQHLSTALEPGVVGAVDGVATWTGSVIDTGASGPDRWAMLYTGVTQSEGVLVPTLLAARSSDLDTWRKDPGVVIGPDACLYETLPGRPGASAAFRDPWVLSDPDGDGWHALFTARAPHGADDDRGVIGHAWSPDLSRWHLRPPLSEPGAGFPFLEVPQVIEVDGMWWLLFSCPADEVSAWRRPENPDGGIWGAPAAGPLGPFDIRGARQLVDDDRYSGRLVLDRTGEPMLLAFHRDPRSPHFLDITDPAPVADKLTSPRP